MFNKLKKLFCKHEWKREVLTAGFLVVDGWLVTPVQYRCKKCGKVVSEAEYERRYGNG